MIQMHSMHLQDQMLNENYLAMWNEYINHTVFVNEQLLWIFDIIESSSSFDDWREKWIFDDEKEGKLGTE